METDLNRAGTWPMQSPPHLEGPPDVSTPSLVSHLIKTSEFSSAGAFLSPPMLMHGGPPVLMHGGLMCIALRMYEKITRHLITRH